MEEKHVVVVCSQQNHCKVMHRALMNSLISSNLVVTANTRKNTLRVTARGCAYYIQFETECPQDDSIISVKCKQNDVDKLVSAIFGK